MWPEMMSPATLSESHPTGVPWRIRAAVCVTYGLVFAVLWFARPSWFSLDWTVLAATLGTYLATWYWSGFVTQEGHGRGYLWTSAFCAVGFTVLSLIVLLTEAT